MPLTPAEKQKRYRERLKNNREKENIQKQKARDRYHKTKILIAKKSNREQRLTRRKWRKYKADERQRSKRLSVDLNETPPSSPDRESVPNPSVARGRKKLRRDRTKLFRENTVLRDENKKLKRSVEKYKKRAQRLNQKEQLSSAPLQKANALIKMSFSSPKSSSAESPFFVVDPSINVRETCDCKMHSNIKLKIKALTKLNALKESDLTLLVQSVVCDPRQKDCMYNICSLCKDNTVMLNFETDIRTIEWYEWVRKLEIFEKDGHSTKVFRTTKEKQTEIKEDFVLKFNKEIICIKKHIFNIKNQYQAYRTCIDNIEPNEAALHIDFSENYNCKFAEEIQAHHFGGSRNQISLHTGVLYIANQEPYSFCSISSNNDHGPSAIWAHLAPILQMIKEKIPNIQKHHFFSDGPTTQYRQKQNFFCFSTKIFDFEYGQATWSFFEAGHGKGAADGIGGVLKRTADRIIAHGRDIVNADQFFELVQPETSVKLFLISTDEIDAIKTSLPADIPVLKGTMTLHQLVLRQKETLEYRDVSCFCGKFSTLDRGFCKCFQPKVYSASYQKKASMYNLIYSPNCSNSEDDQPDPCLGEFLEPYSTKITCGSYVLINISSENKRKQIDYRYVAIAQTEIDNEGEIKVIFLKSINSAKTIFKIEKNDVVDVHSKHIIKELQNPCIKLKASRIFYEFENSIDVLEEIS